MGIVALADIQNFAAEVAREFLVNGWHSTTISGKSLPTARNCMQLLTTEWIGKAEGDLATARRELRARTVANYEAACFHAQQCAEKYLKALLQEAGNTFYNLCCSIFCMSVIRSWSC